MTAQRIDTLLAERGLAAVAHERRRIGARRTRADRPRRPGGAEAQPARRPRTPSCCSTDEPRYVSRGGVKLENALEALGIDVAGLDCLDVGASTGGFTDCLLQRGAARVIALDVAYGQLDWGLRNDPRVTVIERLNARELDARASFPFAPGLATVDVSFISLAKVAAGSRGCLARAASCWRW